MGLQSGIGSEEASSSIRFSMMGSRFLPEVCRAWMTPFLSRAKTAGHRSMFRARGNAPKVPCSRHHNDGNGTLCVSTDFLADVDPRVGVHSDA